MRGKKPKVEPIFPPVKAVRWVKELADQMEDPEVQKQLMDLYWFLVWFHRFETVAIHEKMEKYSIALNLRRYYRHKVFGLKLDGIDMLHVNQMRANLRAMKVEAKKAARGKA